MAEQVAERAGGEATVVRERLLTGPFLFALVATFAYFNSAGVLTPAIPLFVSEWLGGDAASVGLAVGSFSLSALVLRPYVGRLADRRGRKKLMLGGAVLTALSTAAYVAVGESLVALVALRLVTGAGEAMFFVAAIAVIMDLAPPERRGEAMSLFSLAPYAGIAVGPMIGEAVLNGAPYAQRDFWIAWLVATAFAGVAAVGVLRVPETHAPAAAAGPTRLIHRAAILPGLMLLTSWLSFTAFMAFMPLYARELGLSDSRLAFVVFAVIMLTIRSVGARLPDILGPFRAGRAALTLVSAGMALVALADGPVVLLTGTALFAVGNALAFPALLTLALMSAPDHERGSVVGTFTSFIDVGFFLGPVVLGAVSAQLGYGGGFAVAAGVAATGLTGLLVRTARLRTRSADKS